MNDKTNVQHFPFLHPINHGNILLGRAFPLAREGAESILNERHTKRIRDKLNIIQWRTGKALTRGTLEQDIKITSNNSDVCFEKSAAPRALEACLR